MRDLNDEILNNPFDEEMKSIAVGFARLLKPMVENYRTARTEETFPAETLGRGRSVLRIPRRFGFQKRSGLEMQTALREKPRQTFHVPALRRGAMEQQQCRTRHQGICEASGRYLGNVDEKGCRRIPHSFKRGPDLRISRARFLELSPIRREGYRNIFARTPQIFKISKGWNRGLTEGRFFVYLIRGSILPGVQSTVLHRYMKNSSLAFALASPLQSSPLSLPRRRRSDRSWG